MAVSSSIGLGSQARDHALRQRLGIPDDAERVLVFAESSHWDPDWLCTSETYYTRFVQHNLDQAIAALQQEPRRVYSVECIFFLRMYWDRNPDRRDQLRSLLNEGRMRLTSSGVTTADTLLPSTEAILRDFLIGQEWLRKNDVTQEPNLAYFADSFGCSSSLPTLLQAAGFDRTAFTRIDGMSFIGCDFELSRNFPRPGSTAERLLKQEKTLDFVWRDGNGAEALCHWNAFTYGQGDMLASRGLTRAYLFPAAFPARSERFVAKRITQFIDQLDPYRHTPYMFCPIGFDFVPPIDDLVTLLDRYNKRRYPRTGVWVVNAGLDDYLALIECHRADLPTLQIDPNPYWTGFYTTRPQLKKQCRHLVDRLLMSERLALLPENAGAAATINADLADAWWTAVTANHHDFITGTSPDRVVEEEQIPWLKRADKSVGKVCQKLAPCQQAQSRAGQEARAWPSWEREGDKVIVRTPHYVAELDQKAGGCITGARTPETEGPLLTGFSNDLISYRDLGGLWRMGYEFRGGTFARNARASAAANPLEVCQDGDALRVTCSAELGSEVIRRSLWFRYDSPVIRGQIEGRAPKDTTVTLRFGTGLAPDQLTMGEPGGVAQRPLRRYYDPTFWPMQQFVHVRDTETDRGVAVLLEMPSAVACQPDGCLELVALRNATRERAWGIIPIPGNPASGYERETYVFDYGVFFTALGDWRANALPSLAHQFDKDLWRVRGCSQLIEAAHDLVQVNPDSVLASAFKPASRGEGLVVRLINTLPMRTGQDSVQPPPEGLRPSVTLALAGRAIKAAYLCDARERDLRPLDVVDDEVHLTMTSTIATIRLLK